MVYWRKMLKFSFTILRFRLARFSLTTFTESITESSTNDFKMTHTASSSGLPPLSLDGPIVCWNDKMSNIRNWFQNLNVGLVESDVKFGERINKKTPMVKAMKSTYMSAIWPLDIHTVNMLIFGCDTMIYHICDTMYVSYYAAFQNLMYPSSVIQENCFNHKLHTFWGYEKIDLV